MRKLLFSSFMVLAGALALNAAVPRPFSPEADPLRYARIQGPDGRHTFKAALSPAKVQASHTLATDDVIYLDAPDGSTWFATAQFEYETVELPGGMATDSHITAYTYTVYDSDFNKIGSIHDVVRLGEGESKVAAMMLSSTLTKKFYNLNDSYELALSTVYNKAELLSYPYVNTRTEIYTLGGQRDDEGNDVPIATFEGYPVCAVNAATDSYSENFYISYYTESAGNIDDYEDYLDFLATVKSVVTTYKKSGWSGGPEVIDRHEVQQLCLPGDAMSHPFFIAGLKNGKYTIMTAQYAKSFFVDPTGMGGNEDITPDNSLIVNVRQMGTGYGATMQDVCTMTLPTVQDDPRPEVLCTFYSVGSLRYDDDLDFEHYTADGQPAFVVTTSKYLTTDDDNYSESYYVYDAQGNRLLTLAEEVENFVMMSDVPGAEPQAMFIYTDGESYTYDFVDLYSGATAMTVPAILQDRVVTVAIDRVLTADGVLYPCSLNSAYDDAEGNTIHEIGWIAPDGTFSRIDGVNLGKDVAMAQVYIAAKALNPYLFNTDDAVEYMFLVKRYLAAGSSATLEEFLVVNKEGDALMQLQPDDSKGMLLSIGLVHDDQTKLAVAYRDDDYHYTLDLYDLPFSKFGGGSGTEADPYLIASVGDLQQIKSAPGCHYLVAQDFNAGGYLFKGIPEFTGSLDGNGKTISNLTVVGHGLFEYASGAAVRNLTFVNATVTPSGDSASTGLVAGHAMSSQLSNINVYGIAAESEDFNDTFGCLVGYSTLGTAIKHCQVGNARINLPHASVGGLAGSMFTGSTVTVSAFNGRILGGAEVGGIAGMINNDGGIYDCHVKADLSAEHTIGGIVGSSNRAPIMRNHAEGTITALGANRFNGFCVGGIAGYLSATYTDQGAATVLEANLVGIDQINVDPSKLGTPRYEGAFDTAHRIVGWSRVNSEPDYDKVDNDGNPIYGDRLDPEACMANNYVISGLEAFQDLGDENYSTTEGLAMSRWSLEFEMLEALGYAFGDNDDAPWSTSSISAPALYFEQNIVLANRDISAKVGEVFNIEVRLLGRQDYTLDYVLDEFIMEFDVEKLEMTGNAAVVNNLLTIEMKALDAGSSNFYITLFGTTVMGTVNAELSGIENVVAEGADSLRYDGATVRCADARIEIYSLAGVKVASGYGSVGVADLAPGVYVARTPNAALKIAIR